jgi:hypothetical protein
MVLLESSPLFSAILSRTEIFDDFAREFALGQLLITVEKVECILVRFFICEPFWHKAWHRLSIANKKAETYNNYQPAVVELDIKE